MEGTNPSPPPPRSAGSARTPLAPIQPGSGPPSRAASRDEVSMSRQDPLPPIGATSPTIPQATSSEIVSTMAGGGTQENMRSKRPRIIDYRRETDPEDSQPMTGKSSPPAPVTTRHVPSHDVVQTTVSCQTEWSWLDDMTATGGKSRATSKASSRSGKPQKQQRQHRGRGVITVDLTDSDEDDDLLSDEEELLGEDEDEEGEEGRGSGSSQRDKKTPAPSSRQVDSELTMAGSEVSVPFPPKDDEYGIPQLNISSDSESSDSDSEADQYKYKPEEDEDIEADDELATLPSIGPPQILQYQRESGKQGLEHVDPEERHPEPGLEVSENELAEFKEKYGNQAGLFEGTCEFCSEPIRAFPTMEQQKSVPPEELYCCDDYNEFVQYIVQHPVAAEQNKDSMIDIKPHAPYGSGQARKAAKERAAQRMRERELQKQQQSLQGRSDGGGGGGGGPSNFYQSDTNTPKNGQKGGRGFSSGGGAKGGGAKQLQRGGTDSGSGYNPAAISQIARQMKTINYQLSSQKCLDEGWTRRPPSPVFDHERDPEVFEPEPLLPPWAEAGGKAAEQRDVVIKNYEDGSKFVIMFPDGTGNVFYPSGRVAVSIIAAGQEVGLYTYIVQDDRDDPALPNVLASFSSDGHACSFFCSSGTTRLMLDPVGGLELDARGARKRRWNWKDQIQHVHAPPIQPITYAVTPLIGVRIMAQDNITLTFTCRQRSCRLQMGARLKLVAPEYFPDPEIDEDELYRTEVQNRVELLFSKVANLLKFPNSPKLSRLPTPQHITSRVHKMEKIKEIQTARKSNKKKAQSTPIVSVN